MHRVGDPVYWLKDGIFGYISNRHFDETFKEHIYVITWFLSEEIQSAWLEETFIEQCKRDLRIYLGEIPPTEVR